MSIYQLKFVKMWRKLLDEKIYGKTEKLNEFLLKFDENAWKEKIREKIFGESWNVYKNLSKFGKNPFEKINIC